MMKAILISIKPKHVANILNGLKTIEIRKKFPSDYVGWVYIYCTKDKNNLLHKNCANIWWVEDKDFQKKNKRLGIEQQPIYNGKVVARFWCDKVEDYVNGHKWSWKSGAPMFGACNDYEYILKDTCLTEDELYDYCEDLSFKAIHITNLEIFDKPKEIKEFKSNTKRFCEHCSTYSCMGKYHRKWCYKPLTRAPQSYCFIEV